MGTTQPIKNKDELNDLKNYYRTVSPNLRNYALIVLGVNSALRISDLLSLTWSNVYDFTEVKFKKHIVLQEQKTKKENIIALNENVILALKEYKQTLPDANPTSYLFPGRDRSTQLSRCQTFRIIKTASEAVHIEQKVSCHSLRKTFGYHAWRGGTSPVLLMSIYNHSSYQITKRYLGIDQDDKDTVFLNINL